MSRIVPLTQHLPSEWMPGVDELTRAERRVLNLLLTGMSKAEVARHLNTTRGTVAGTMAQLYSKLNVSSHIQLLGLCIEALMPGDS